MENNDNKEIEIEHRLVIEEEGIEISDLPKEIRQAMRAFNQKLAKYEQTGNEDLYYELQQDDVAIADGIENWIEDNESEDDDEDESYLEQQEAKAQAEAQAKAQASQQNQGSQVEQKILSTAKNNIISLEDLQNIIGREPDYPIEKIGQLTLKKQYLKPFYEIA